MATCEKLKIKQIEEGWQIKHPKHGHLTYSGLATVNPYSDKPKIPHLHIFWSDVDENGNSTQIIEKNGNTVVEVIHRF
jgi:hypothetical protein